MKTYFVKTQTENNAHRLHSMDMVEFSTTDFAEAQAVYEKEVAQLAQEYVTADYFEYAPSDAEVSNAVYCSIIAIDSEDEDEVEFIQDSDYFYEK